MNEVEKMYENAGIEKVYEYVGHYPKTDENGIILPMIYPPFTAEKQLELIKWLIRNDISDERIIRSNYEKTYYYCLFTWEHPFHESEAFTKFEEALAYIFNYIWQDLTEEECKQIKEILNG